MNFKKRLNSGFVVVLLWAIHACGLGCEGARAGTPPRRNYFIGVKSFQNFEPGRGNGNDVTLLSPEYSAPLDWTELVASWNVEQGISMKVEARLLYPDHTTHFYNLGEWSDDPSRHHRQSEPHQKDSDAQVKTDTLILNHTGARVQVRLTLHEPSGNSVSMLKFLGLSFCDRKTKDAANALPVKSAAWGKIIEVPERRQGEYEGGGGWCSPTSLSMVLAYWSNQLNRPELNHSVPETAAAIMDVNLPGTGNWPFNTCYAGEYAGIRAYVTRLDDVSELEQWIAAGIPPIVSVSSYLTRDRHFGPDAGHLIVCVGFDENGDVVTNDPGVSVKANLRARRTYPRARFCAAWKKSGNTAYLIYPVEKSPPADPNHHWDSSMDSLPAGKHEINNPH